MIPFNKASITDREIEYAADAMRTGRLSGDGKYTERVYGIMKEKFGLEDVFLTTSGSSSLELATLLVDIKPGDEVIVPSFTFSSTANAFMLRGGIPVFCDIREDTMNIDERLIEDLITDRTKAIFPIDYAGIPADYDKILEIANRHGLKVVEDAAQSLGSTYKGRACGTFGDVGCYSFHETKNYVMGEGGGVVINDKSLIDRAEILREKGTNRRQVLKGMVDKYTWHDIGGSFLPSDVLAAILAAQLERFDELTAKRMVVWNTYHEGLRALEAEGYLRRQFVPDYAGINAHMYNILLPSDEIRTALISALKEQGIYAYICYVPLHSAPLGQRYGYKPESCPVTEDYGKRDLRLPLYADMTESDALLVVDTIDRTLRSL